jgi:hypothetical protein
MTGRGSSRSTVITNFPVGNDETDHKNLLGLPSMQQLGVSVPLSAEVVCIYPLEPLEI